MNLQIEPDVQLVIYCGI